MSDMMPNGVTKPDRNPTDPAQPRVDLNAVMASLKTLYETSAKNDKAKLKKTIDTFDTTTKRYLNFQKSIENELVALKESGASRKDLETYLKPIGPMLKQQDELYQKEFKNIFEEIDRLYKDRTFNSLAERKLNEEQLVTLRKSFELQEKDVKQKAGFFDNVRQKLGGMFGNVARNSFDALIGPLQLLTKPLEELANFSLADEVGDAFTKKTEKFFEKKEKTVQYTPEQFLGVMEDNTQAQVEASAEQAELTRDVIKKPEEETLNPLNGALKLLTAPLEQLALPAPPEENAALAQAIGDKVGEALEGTKAKRKPRRARATAGLGENEAISARLGALSEQLNGEPESVQPTRSELLKQGVEGSAAVYIVDALLKKGEKPKEEPGFLDKLMDSTMGAGSKGVLKKLGNFFAGPGGALLFSAGTLAAGVAMTMRDIGDADKYFQQGKTGQAVETMLLGDRERVAGGKNEASETSFQAGKWGLLAGGTAATTATVGAITAGGLSAATLSGALSAFFPPALIAASLAAMAKGVQVAFVNEYDKLAEEMNYEATKILNDENASFIDKVKTGASNLWHNFTSPFAGGIREAADEVGKKDGVVDKILAGTVGFFSGLGDTIAKQRKGQERARIEGMIEGSFKRLNEEQIASLKQTELYQQKLAEYNGDTEKALKETYTTLEKNRLEKDGMYGVGDKLKEWGNAIGNFFSSVADFKVKDVSLRDVGKATRDTFKSFMGKVQEGTSAFFKDVQQKGIVPVMYDKISSIGATTKEYLGSGVEVISKFYDKVVDGVGAFFNNINSTFATTAKDYIGKIAGMIGDFFGGLANSITSFFSGIGKEVGDKGVLGTVGSRFKIGLGASNQQYQAADFLYQKLGDAGVEDLLNKYADRSFFSKNDFAELFEKKEGIEALKAAGFFESAQAKAGNITPEALGFTSVKDAIITPNGQVIKTAQDDTIIATKNEPRVLDRDIARTNEELAQTLNAADPYSPDILEAIKQLTAALKDKPFNNVVTQVSQGQGFDFDALRLGGAY